ncbi:protocadherin gamma-A6-like isoform X2 [Cyprinodon tularosa]|uniref:protocadherin gamma-A6-like isoform X2 n=1 Tax=Cyprinodon tularosa TaxID=77115 RepID=UPI0018E20C7C|nr:protocadherin gamma-A6-like isoform X2 [Cyprinodon tularosa]
MGFHLPNFLLLDNAKVSCGFICLEYILIELTFVFFRLDNVGRTMRGQVLFFLVLSLCSVLGRVSYSIPEEMPKGSLVGDVVKDFGVDIKRLKSGKARIFSRDSDEYVELHKERGVLLIKNRIDRETLCGQLTPCVLLFQIILENPMEFYSVTVEITDINDNPPSFEKSDVNFKISELAVRGAKFVLDRAFDLDVGINALHTYTLEPNDNFVVRLHDKADGSKNVEMILEKPLDREKQEHLSLVLTALDGGEPQMTGTMQILVTVLDANDNAPVFTEPVYKSSIVENMPIGTVVMSVTATDADQGSNGRITYTISSITENGRGVFEVNAQSGEIVLRGNVDYEKSQSFQMHIRASDDGGLGDSCKVIIDVSDLNDNKPNIQIISKSNVIPEDAKLGTVVTMINVEDADSGDNGKVQCSINKNIPFEMKSSSGEFYSVTTDNELDREITPEYNITVTCYDEGIPSLSSSVNLTLQVSDVNDNAPVFERSSYEAYVVENNSPGLSIFTVKATDADWNQNARVFYMLEDSSVNGVPVSSYVSISADSGVIHTVRSFDYEQIKDFQFRIKAQDGGSPPKSSNISVKIQIQDQNDNPPQVLYPVLTGSSVVAEMVPRSADVGYLVNKVVAVDVDSGQNAWLSYKLQKATDRALFEVGLQNGEIRTIRQVTDKDAVKQRLTVIVEDNGQPSRSATVIVNVAVADSFPEVLSEFTEFPHDKEYNENLTFYLVLALAVVSFLFITCLVVIISVKIYRWRQSRILYHSSLPVIPYYPPRYSDTLGTGTLPHVYNYDMSRTTDSRKSDSKFCRDASENVLIMDPCSTGTIQRIQSEKSILDEPDSPLEQKPPNNDWRFTQGQRPGPSGPHMPYGTHIRWTPKNGTRATGGPEVAMGTGPWPQPPTEAEQLQALMAAANVSEATATLGPGTMGLSTRYSPQFTLQHVPDYRQNVYIPGSTATLTSNPQQQQATAQQATQQALPPPQASAQAEPPKAAQTPASKKKSTKKEKK